MGKVILIPKKGEVMEGKIEDMAYGGKGIVKIVSFMMKMSNFLAKNVIMTNSLMLSRSEIGSHEVGKKIH